MNIRPVSDLRNNYREVEAQVQSTGPVFLTKNGHGSMVVMSIEQYEFFKGNIEHALDVADMQAKASNVRMTHEEVFGSIKKELEEKAAQT